MDDCARDTTTACSVSLGSSVTGDIERIGDVDFFSLSVTSGARYEIDAEGSATSMGTLANPFLTRHDAAGNEIDSNDDAGDGANARIIWTAGSTGTVYVTVSQAANNNTGTYTLTVSARSADDCAGDTTTTCSVAPGSSATGDLDHPQDEDYFRLSATSGVTYQIDAEGSETSMGTLADPYVILRDASDMGLASDDDGGDGLNASLTWTADSTTTVYVDIRARGDAGGTYTLTVSANTPATGAPTISGTAQVGQTLTAATSGIMDSDGLTSPTYTYQWIRVNGTEADISGATSSTYTLVAADLGKTIKVKVSFTDDNSNAETLTSAATVTVTAAANNLATGTAAISGPATVGQTLSATIGSIADADGLTNASFAVQWVRVDGGAEADISGATGSTYTLVAADAGKTIKVRISFTDDLGNSESRTSAATSAVAAAADDCAGDTTSTCSVSPGTPVTGEIESSGDADVFSLSLTSGVTYQIDAEGSDTSKGTLDDPFLFLRNAAGTQRASNEDGGAGRNARIVWTATTTETGYVDVQDSSAINTGTYTLTVSAANSPATGAPTISGTAVVGEPMRAVTSGIMDSDGLTSPTYTYQWIRVDGATESDISGATSSTYTPVAADLGKTIKVKVSFTDDASNAETLTSAATSAVTVAAVSTTVPVAIGNLAAEPGVAIGTVDLNWTVPDEGGAAIGKFQVRRKGGTGSYGAWGDIASSGATTNSHIVTDLVYGWPYAFQVRAVNSYGEGADSNEAMVRTPTDFEHLQNGHTGPFGMWSPDGLVLWVGRFTSREVRVYNLSSQDIQPSDQWRLNVVNNNKPAGIWSDASYIYVLQAGSTAVYVYSLGDKSYEGFFPLNQANSDPRGIWSDGATVWVSDAADKKVYAYQLSSFNFATSRDIDLHALHAKARDIWSDGDWMWVLDNTDKAAYAYRLDNGLRSPSQDIVLETSGRNYVSLWSDGATLYALDNGSGQPGKIYERPLSDRGWVRPPTNTTTVFMNRASSSSAASAVHRMRQRFTTGPSPNGYYLAIVGLGMNSTGRLASVSIHSDKPGDATQHKLFDLIVDQAGTIRYHRTPETAGTEVVLEANTDYWILVTADGETNVYSTAEEASGLTFYTGIDGWKLHTKPGIKGADTSWQVTSRNGTMSTQLNAWACVDEHCTNVFGHRPSAPAVAATRRSVAAVDLEWTAPASAGNHAHYAIERYLVERSTDGGSTWSELVRDLAPDVTSYSDSESTAPISTRRYRVVAANVEGYTEDADRSAGVAPAGGEITLVSNIDQSPTTSADSTVKQAQAFTTGADAAFYTLHSVVVEMGGGNCEAALYTADSNGYPDTLHASLTRVGGSCNGKVVFTAPANTQLAASSTYTVQLSPVSGSVSYKTTTATAEDSAGLAGWSIANKKARGATGGGWTQPSAVALKIRIRGNPIDFGSLAASHTGPIGIWSPDGSTLWVGQWFSTQVYAYNLADETLDSGENWELHNPATAGDRNRKPTGIWSNGTHIYVTDPDHDRVFEYNVGDKSLTSNVYTLHADNGNRQGLWSDGTTAWVSDDDDDKLYAYALSDFSRDSGKDIDLHSDNTAPRGIWSDGNTIWVLDRDDKKLYAYALAGGSRRAGQDITLDSAGENYNSIWSDGETMYVIENAGGSATRDPRIHKLPLSGAVLVSNASQTALASLSTGSGIQAYAQAFTTGSNYQGYKIDTVGVLSGGSNAFSVGVYTTTSNGAPDTLHATLTPPDSFTVGGTAVFTAPADTVLERDTTYTLRMTPDSGAMSIGYTASGAEDSASLAGWTIRNGNHNLPNNGPWVASSAQGAFIIAIKGTPNPATVPAAITDLRASAGDAEVALSWGLPDHGGSPLTKFQYRQKEGSGAWESWNDFFTTTSYTVPNLTNDTEYTFQVRAVNAIGDAQPSNEATATPRADDCGQSSDDMPCMVTVGTSQTGTIDAASDHDWYELDAKADKTYQIDLQGAPSNNGTLRDPQITSLYTVALGYGGGPIPDTHNDNISPANKDARVIWTAPRAMTVFIGAGSSDRFGTGVYGTGTYTLEVTESSGPAPPQPDAPGMVTDLRASGFDGHVSLLWTVPADGGSAITEFEYRQKEGSGAYGGWLDVPNSGPLTSGYAVPNLTNDTEYTFQVRAVNGVGDGPASNAASATPAPPRPPPRPGPGGGGGSGGNSGGEDVAPVNASELFEDVEAGVWYEQAVSWMILHRVTSGCATTLFCPEANLSRRQFVTFLWRAAGRPAAPYLGSEVFGDVTEGGYAEQSIGWAVANGVTAGCTPGEFGDPDWMFCPTQDVTRGQMATLLYRHVEAGYQGGAPPYSDVEPDRYYAPGISWLTDFEVVPGCGPGLFCPDRAATRAEAAVFINGVAIRPHIWGLGNTSFIPQPQ